MPESRHAIQTNQGILRKLIKDEKLSASKKLFAVSLLFLLEGRISTSVIENLYGQKPKETRVEPNEEAREVDLRAQEAIRSLYGELNGSTSGESGN